MDAEQQLHRLLASSGESEVVEFKEAKNGYDFSKLGKYFSALSNEANLKGVPSAWLVFGVRDNLQVVGSQFREAFKDLQSLKKEVADKVSQRLSFIDIHTVLHPDGRVLLFEIPAAPQGLPVTWEGHYYGRDGESLGPLSLEEIERIRGQNRPQDWSAGICPGASLADLSTEAIALARREFATKHPKMAAELPAWSDETFLNKSKLTIQGQITRTAILLLGKPEAAHWLNPASPTISWILKDRDGSERDYQHFLARCWLVPTRCTARSAT
ncbi:ATP-binding protein [Pseudomonas syringae]|uniref:ATP-binding protein n=1 Tax=Pseudomonas syringae TaxID=317 RepID=UPI001F0F59F7|nr:ATP-binding protein [Pseudomonas syringae]MCH5510513.1 ATP-binding protein [Pseudomonas syringae pv. syringae]MCH5639214.1 ATP-binding protein [Pseudomonas syringae pv. syringae]MCH7428403.1 ATP-binding protein [Pseudomonas syringae pv. syringae]